jgi:hypothetical protein
MRFDFIPRRLFAPIPNTGGTPNPGGTPSAADVANVEKLTNLYQRILPISEAQAKHKAEETRVSWNNCANKQGMNHSIETYTSKRIFNYGIDYNMSILLVIDGVEYAIDKAENDSKENVLLDIHRYYGIGGPGENEYVLINKTTNLNLTLVSRDGVKTNFVLNRNTGVNLIKQKVPIFETEIIINGQECSDVSLPVHDTLSTLFDYATGAVNKAKRLIW